MMTKVKPITKNIFIFSIFNYFEFFFFYCCHFSEFSDIWQSTVSSFIAQNMFFACAQLQHIITIVFSCILFFISITHMLLYYICYYSYAIFIIICFHFFFFFACLLCSNLTKVKPLKQQQKNVFSVFDFVSLWFSKILIFFFLVLLFLFCIMGHLTINFFVIYFWKYVFACIQLHLVITIVLICCLLFFCFYYSYTNVRPRAVHFLSSFIKCLTSIDF